MQAVEVSEIIRQFNAASLQHAVNISIRGRRSLTDI
jgi:hypothetical protein